MVWPNGIFGGWPQGPSETQFTIPANMAGIPGVAVPCGFSDGLPVSLQILGPAFAEDTLLRVAHAYEQAESWHTVKPPALLRAGSR